MARDAKRQQSPLETTVLAALRDAMKKQMPQYELAAKVDLSTGQLSDIFTGKKPASFTEMDDIAKALGLDLATVIGEVKKPAPKPEPKPKNRGAGARSTRRTSSRDASPQVDGHDSAKSRDSVSDES